MDRAHIYEYLYKESSKEKTMNSRLRHFTPPPLRFWRFLYVVVKNAGGLRFSRNSTAHLESYPECHL